MYFCYIDEAGCTGNLPSYQTDIQPIFILCGLFIPSANITELTHDFLALKRKFNPSLSKSLTHDLDIVRHEIKGAEDLRKHIRKKNRNNRRRAIGLLDKTIELLRYYDCQIVPKIYIKSPTDKINGVALYARFVQSICHDFQWYLSERSSKGVVIADSRTYDLNTKVSHSIFTQKFKATGDAYPNIDEMPLYGHSDNHVAIQLTDILCSALLFPIASYSYCSGHIQSIHVNSRYEDLRKRYANQLKELSYRYFDGTRCRGGITIHDALEQRSANAFFLNI